MKTSLVLRVLLLVALLGAALSTSGCATAIVAQLRNKLPKVEADELSVDVTIAGIGGGKVVTKGQHFDEKGNLVLDEIHETVKTGASSLVIDGKGIKIPNAK